MINWLIYVVAVISCRSCDPTSREISSSSCNRRCGGTSALSLPVAKPIFVLRFDGSQAQSEHRLRRIGVVEEKKRLRREPFTEKMVWFSSSVSSHGIT